MSDDQPPARASNGGLMATVSHLGSAVVASVPPSFLGLALVNAIFLGVVFLFLDHVMNLEARVAEQRLDMFEKVISTCMQQTAQQNGALVEAQRTLVETHRRSMEK